jgi:hypothetical protein
MNAVHHVGGGAIAPGLVVEPQDLRQTPEGRLRGKFGIDPPSRRNALVALDAATAEITVAKATQPSSKFSTHASPLAPPGTQMASFGTVIPGTTEPAARSKS